EAVQTLREVSGNRVLMSMVILAGLGSFFIGSSVQAAMPAFAEELGIGSAGAAYGLLLFATGVGGVVGGFVLEATGGIAPNVRTAMISTFVVGLSTAGFALIGNYVVALVLLVVAGVANMVSMSVGQTVVQLAAPPDMRGRVVGVYAMSSGGLRAGSGLTVGMLGILTGIHWSLAISAATLCVCTVLVAILTNRNRTHDSEVAYS
ncbi:MAG: MFS transporter, partial [Propionibacteriaceae bacterium]